MSYTKGIGVTYIHGDFHIYIYIYIYISIVGVGIKYKLIICGKLDI